jgi:hypothetical protein
MRRLVYTALAVFSLLAFGCAGEDGLLGCTTGAWRCHDNKIEFCGTYGWEFWQNCGSISEVCVSGPNNCSGYDVACCR